MLCIQVFPDSCHCAYGIAKSCYDKCGGPSPGLNTCPPLNPRGGISLDGPVKRNASPEPQDVVSELLAGLLKPKPVKTCKCDQTVCVQSWPASCYCAKAAKQACYKKCGGKKPAPMVSSLATNRLRTVRLTMTGLPRPKAQANPETCRRRIPQATSLWRWARELQPPMPQWIHLHE